MNGIGVSSGIGYAAALKYDLHMPEISGQQISDIPSELDRFWAAFQAVEKQLHALHTQSLEKTGKENAAIFEAHLMLLQDEDSVSIPITQRISDERMSAAAATEQTFDEIYELITSVGDELIAQRGSDILDLKNQLLYALLGIQKPDLSHLPKRVVLVARDLTPSDTIGIDLEHVAGILCQSGGRTSHSAILAKAMGIPAIVGCTGILDAVNDGDDILMDGQSGTVIVRPTQEDIDSYAQVAQRLDAEKQALEQFRGKQSLTADGVSVKLSANIASPEECRLAVGHDCEGVGLFRSEFLYMDRSTLPSEEEQFEAYRKALTYAEGREVTIRTLDVGGDKGLKSLTIHAEENPFLGYRAIRICLDRPALFQTQLRALYRASVFGKLRIMFPMIATLEELRAAKEAARQARESLRRDGIAFCEDVPLGIMIEVPSAAVSSDLLAKECDFFSIGTNDLTQYTMAVDRGNEKVSKLYSHYHPGVIRLIAMTIRNAAQQGIECCMCGEAAGDFRFIPLLLGLGLRNFSMSAVSILKARQIISRNSCAEWQAHAQTVMRLGTAEEIIELCNQTEEPA